MSKAYLAAANIGKKAPQTVKARDEQVKNNAGGFVFAIDPWARLNRFLFLGSEGGSYYTKEAKLTEENAQNVLNLIKEDGVRVVNTLVEISDAGRAPKNSPALFVLALCLSKGNEDTKRAASEAVTKVARIGTHLFELASYLDGLGGWGKGKRRALAKFYTEKTPDRLAYDLIKYQQRNGWSHKDTVALTHPWAAYHKAGGDNELYRYLTKGALPENPLIRAFESLKKSGDKKKAIHYIEKFNFPREALPTELLTDADIWRAMLPSMPMTALIRNLPTLTRLGVFDNVKHLNIALEKLEDRAALQKARVHPFSILVAIKSYASGGGIGKTQHTWKPNRRVIDSLNVAFYDSFNYVEATGKNFGLFLDVSGSMRSNVLGNEFITCAEAGAALAMTIARTEKNYYCKWFSQGGGGSRLRGENSGISDLNITPKTSLKEAAKEAIKHNFGGTDIALPCLWAIENKVDIDTFIVVTDNETWAGTPHPFQALREYRNKMNKPNAKLVVIALTASNFTIADPSDAGMLDIPGFDSNIPTIVNEFTRGSI